MKKSYIKYFVCFVAVFCFNLINVNAQKLCVYGSGSGSNWEKKFTLDIDAENPFYLINDSSPLLKESFKNGGLNLNMKESEPIYSSAGEECFGMIDKTCTKYQFQGHINFENDLEILYKVKKPKNGECPSKMNVAALFFGKNANNYDYWEYDNVVFYDEWNEATAMKFLNFDKSEENNAWFHKNRKWDEDVYDTYILESKKDDPTALDSCDAYEDYYDDLKETLKDKDGNVNPEKCDNNAEFDKQYNELLTTCEALRSSASYADKNGRGKSCMKACSNLRDDIDDLCKIKKSASYCGSLGNGIVNWIFKIIRIIRYTLPPVMIILSILDFIKAITEEDENKMKEATKRFFRRLIAVALLFVIPFIINFILNMFNIPGLNASNPFCAK